MAKWKDITRDEKYQILPDNLKQEIKTTFFENNIAPTIEGNKTLEQIGKQNLLNIWLNTPDDSGQGAFTSGLSSIGRGFASVVPGVVGGAGYLTGSEELQQAGADIESTINEYLPVNPVLQDSFGMKALNAVGQAGSMMLTGGAGAAAGKALGMAGAVAKGAKVAALGEEFMVPVTQAALNRAVAAGAERTVLGAAALQGGNEGGKLADYYGLEGMDRAGMILGHAILEPATEKMLFGTGAETALARRALASGERGAFKPLYAIGSEGVEEFAAEVGSNVLQIGIAPEGARTPGVFENSLEATALGMVGGATFAGAGLMSRQPATVTPTTETPTRPAELRYNEMTGKLARPTDVAPTPLNIVRNGIVYHRDATGAFSEVMPPDSLGAPVLRVLDPTDSVEGSLISDLRQRARKAEQPVPAPAAVAPVQAAAPPPVREVAPADVIVPAEKAKQAEEAAVLGGLGWSKQVDLSEPVGVFQTQDGPEVFDGGKRVLAAAMTGQTIKIAGGEVQAGTATIGDFSNPDEFYRVVTGKAAFDDLVSTGQVRTNAAAKVEEGATLLERLAERPTAFPSFSKGSVSTMYARDNPDHYVIVTDDSSMQPSNSGRHSKGKTMFPTNAQGEHQTTLGGDKVRVYRHTGDGNYQLVYDRGALVAGSDSMNTPANSPKAPEQVAEQPKSEPAGKALITGPEKVNNPVTTAPQPGTPVVFNGKSEGVVEKVEGDIVHITKPDGTVAIAVAGAVRPLESRSPAAGGIHTAVKIGNSIVTTPGTHYDAVIEYIRRNELPAHQRNEHDWKEKADAWLVKNGAKWVQTSVQEGFIINGTFHNRQDSLKKLNELGIETPVATQEKRDWLDSSDIQGKDLRSPAERSAVQAESERLLKELGLPTKAGEYTGINAKMQKALGRMALDTSLPATTREVARVLLGVDFSKVTLRIIADKSVQDAGSYLPYKEPGHGVLTLNLVNLGHDVPDKRYDLLHELLHHATIWKIFSQGDAFTKAKVLDLNRMRRRALAYAAANAKSSAEASRFHYEMSNVDEYVSALFTNVAFQKFLAGIPADFTPSLSGRVRSLLQESFRIIASILTGHEVVQGSLLDESFGAALNLVQSANTVGGASTPGVKGSYAGESADMPQLMRDSLETAKAMAAAGKTSEEIRAVTGWFPGKYDGKMRFEVPDDGARFTQKWKTAKTVGEAITHSALFQAYPEAANIPLDVFFDQNGTDSGHILTFGGADPATGKPDNNTTSVIEIRATSEALGLSTLIHEIQHWIQRKEGFAIGGNSLALSKLYDFIGLAVNRSKLAKVLRGAADLQDKVGRFSSDSVNALPQDQIDVAFGAYHTTDNRWMSSVELRREAQRLDDLIINSDLTGYEAYRKLAGEIESRDIQARQNFTPEQRKAIAPYSSENIAKEDAIVMFGGTGANMSMSDETVKRLSEKEVEAEIRSHAPEMAKAAQEQYDTWDQDGDGMSEELGEGGICDLIANELGSILSQAGFDVADGGQEGDDHAYIYASKDGYSFAVDIHPSHYERGAGYSWKKIPGVVFDGDHIDISKVEYEDVHGGPWSGTPSPLASRADYRFQSIERQSEVVPRSTDGALTKLKDEWKYIKSVEDERTVDGEVIEPVAYHPRRDEAMEAAVMDAIDGMVADNVSAEDVLHLLTRGIVPGSSVVLEPDERAIFGRWLSSSGRYREFEGLTKQDIIKSFLTITSASGTVLRNWKSLLDPIDKLEAAGTEQTLGIFESTTGEKADAAWKTLQDEINRLTHELDAARGSLQYVLRGGQRGRENKDVDRAEKELETFRTQLAKDGAQNIADAFFVGNPSEDNRGELVKGADTIKQELSKLLNEALEMMGIPRAAAPTVDEYQRIAIALGLDEVKSDKLAEIDKLIRQRIEEITEQEPDASDWGADVLDQWETASSVMTNSAVSGATSRRVLKQVMKENDVRMVDLVNSSPDNLARSLNALVDIVLQRVRSAGSTDTRNLRETLLAAGVEMVQTQRAIIENRKALKKSEQEVAGDVIKEFIRRLVPHPNAPKPELTGIRELVDAAIHAKRLTPDFIERAIALGLQPETATILGDLTLEHGKQVAEKREAARIEREQQVRATAIRNTVKRLMTTAKPAEQEKLGKFLNNLNNADKLGILDFDVFVNAFAGAFKLNNLTPAVLEDLRDTFHRLNAKGPNGKPLLRGTPRAVFAQKFMQMVNAVSPGQRWDNFIFDQYQAAALTSIGSIMNQFSSVFRILTGTDAIARSWAGGDTMGSLQEWWRNSADLMQNLPMVLSGIQGHAMGFTQDQLKLGFKPGEQKIEFTKEGDQFRIVMPDGSVKVVSENFRKIARLKNLFTWRAIAGAEAVSGITDTQARTRDVLAAYYRSTGMTPAAARAKAFSDLQSSPQERAAAEAQARAEQAAGEIPPGEREVKSRVREIIVENIDNSLAIDLIERVKKLTAAAQFKTVPTGLFGHHIYNFFRKLTGNSDSVASRTARFFFLFGRFLGHTVDSLLAFNPATFVFTLGGKDTTSKRTRDIIDIYGSVEEYNKQQGGKAAAGVAFLLGTGLLMALAESLRGDDDEPFFEVFGTAPGADRNRKEALQAAGKWKEGVLRFNVGGMKTEFNYMQIPELAPLFALLGGMSDYAKFSGHLYTKDGKDLPIENAALLTGIDVLASPIKRSTYKQWFEFAKSVMDGRKSDAVWNIMTQPVGTALRLPVVTDADKLYRELEGAKDPKGLGENLLRRVPFVHIGDRMFNSYGEQLPGLGVISMFPAENRSSPDVEKAARLNVFTGTVRALPKDPEMADRELTSEEREAFVKSAGEFYVESMLRNEEAIKRAFETGGREAAQKIITNISSKANKRAKDKLGLK